jgi:hypothetical protein
MQEALHALEEVKQAINLAYSSGYSAGKQQRQWVGLTDEDCKRMSAGDKLVAMWADRTLKERNGY